MTLHRSLCSSFALLVCQSLLGCDEDFFDPPGAADAGVDAGVRSDGGPGGAAPGHSAGGGGAGGAGSSAHDELDGSIAGTACDDDGSGLDAGPIAPLDGGDGCAPTTLYRDVDGDAHGDASQQRTGCPEPGWATQPGDCRDDNPLVHPGQVAFFGVAYDDADQPGGVSFDYDCSGAEDPDPSNTPSSGMPSCTDIVDVLSCMGSGYLEVSGRDGSGVDPLCGSQLRRDCVVRVILGCMATDTELPESEAFRCR